MVSHRYQGAADGSAKIADRSFVQGDVREPIDLVEEVARIWGYNEVPATIPEGTASGGYSDEHAFCEQVRQAW